MKFPPIHYHVAENLEDALEVLARHGDEAQILAGGQSLMPALAFRVTVPTLLIDINRVSELQGIAFTNTGTCIRALVRHAAIDESQEVCERLPLIGTAVRHVAHPAVRNRGTFGGSVALADPAAEFPACCVALGAEIVVQSASRGRRAVSASNFYRGLFETDRAEDEAVVEVLFPRRAPRERFGFAEFSRRHGDFAISGIAFKARVRDDSQTIEDLRIVVFGSEAFPRLLPGAAEAAKGQPLTPKTAEAVAAAVASEIDPIPSPGAGVALKRQLARTLCGRTLAACGEGA